MKNESYFKLMFPKPGGLGGDKYDIGSFPVWLGSH